MARVDDDYRVETLDTVSGFVTVWVTQASCLTLKQAESARRAFEKNGKQTRVKHGSDY
jgi:hypothetical protein